VCCRTRSPSFEGIVIYYPGHLQVPASQGLDLTEAGFADVEPKPTGRPGYAPGDLLKLYIYGYLNRVRSSRRLEAETHRNVEVI
jgi:transposase